MIRQGVFSEFLTVSDINPFPFHKKKNNNSNNKKKYTLTWPLISKSLPREKNGSKFIHSLLSNRIWDLPVHGVAILNSLRKPSDWRARPIFRALVNSVNFVGTFLWLIPYVLHFSHQDFSDSLQCWNAIGNYFTNVSTSNSCLYFLLFRRISFFWRLAMQCISFMLRYLTRWELTSERHSINKYIITDEAVVNGEWRTLIDCLTVRILQFRLFIRKPYFAYFFLLSAILILWLQWPTFAHVRYIKILTWLQGFLVIFLYLVWFSLCSPLFGIVRQWSREKIRLWAVSLFHQI